MSDLAQLQARIAARRARDLSQWQARVSALPRSTPHTCKHCGSDTADLWEADDGWSCGRCRRGPVVQDVVLEHDASAPRCRALLPRTNEPCGRAADNSGLCGWHQASSGDSLGPKARALLLALNGRSNVSVGELAKAVYGRVTAGTRNRLHNLVSTAEARGLVRRSGKGLVSAVMGGEAGSGGAERVG